MIIILLLLCCIIYLLTCDVEDDLISWDTKSTDRDTDECKSQDLDDSDDSDDSDNLLASHDTSNKYESPNKPNTEDTDDNHNDSVSLHEELKILEAKSATGAEKVTEPNKAKPDKTL